LRLSAGSGVLLTDAGADRLGTTLEPAAGGTFDGWGGEVAAAFGLESPFAVLLRPTARFERPGWRLRAGPQWLVGGGGPVVTGVMAGAGARLLRTQPGLEAELVAGGFGDETGLVPAATVELRLGVTYDR
jgi:hypothetical protein